MLAPLLDLWLTPRTGTALDDDWFGTELDPLVTDPEDAAAPYIKQESPAKLQHASKPVLADSASEKSVSIKQEERCYVVAQHDHHAHKDDGYEEDDEGDDESHGCCGHYSAGEVQSEAEGLLDDTTWFDFGRSPLVSPSVPLASPSLRDKPSALNPAIKQEEPFVLPDIPDYNLPELTDDEVAALVDSPSPSAMSMSSTNAFSAFDATARTTHGVVHPQRKLLPAPAHASTSAEKDIPDMVNMFSSMHSPSEAVRLSNVRRSSSSAVQPPAPHPGASLSILVPTPHMYPTMFPFTTTGASVPSAGTAGAPGPASAHGNASSSSTGASVNQFDYFTPPGYAANGSQLNPSVFLNAAETLSPASKPPMLASAATATAQSRAYAQAHAHAAAVAMANSAAAVSTMRKLNTTYGVPIAPLQRTLHPELKPKPASTGAKTAAAAVAVSSSGRGGSKTLLAAATSAASKALLAPSASASKVTKISITPDISDFKLVQIFHSFCDPATKLITLARFHQLVQHHQGKEDASAAAAAANKQQQQPASSKASAPISSETQRLFRALDPKGTGAIDLERFMSSFQICNRCTEAKRRAHSAHCASHGQAFVATALERQLMEDVAPVIVRVVPTSYEGSKVKSCEHYQWTWCEGFEKTGNEKCRGTNRHDKCPKYLANCTLWKHKLPPKNRKAKQVLENQESPSKKFKHFA